MLWTDPPMERDCECLEHQIRSTGVIPLVRVTEPIQFPRTVSAPRTVKTPRTVSQLKPFMSSTHGLHKYLPALAESSALLRPLVSWKMNIIGHWSVKKRLIS